MESIQTLPPLLNLSSSSLSFLNDKLSTEQALSEAPNLVFELQNRCGDLNRSLIDLSFRLESILAAYASTSSRIGGLSGDLIAKLKDLITLTRVPDSSPDGAGVGRTEHVLGEELPALAREVARVEMVRMYADTASRLDTLVGEIEDAVSSAVNNKLRKHSLTHNSNDAHLIAIEKLKTAEDVLSSITKTHPQWVRLVSAVDLRVDRALAILRPQAIADYRALLTSLGWPPNLVLNPDTERSSEIQNPLFTVQGHLKNLYYENFLALCRLQELQRQRKYRQLEGHNKGFALNQPLWAIEELVSPISIACQRHFSRWTHKPEFIFALVYKITRDYVDSMDEMLQPLVDEAMLLGYSCREEWISAMVTSLRTYMAKEIFPIYVGHLSEESMTVVQSQGRISWLHLVDLMISFDKRIQSLVMQSGISLSIHEGGTLQKISSLSIFCDRPDWLDIWAEIELTDSIDKLNAEMLNERNWTKKIPETVSLLGAENYKSPVISAAILQCLSSVIDRCRSLPSISLRSRFLKLAGTPIIQKFLDYLLLRCQEAEGLTALTDNDALVKVANSLNAAHYFESVLKGWCEDVFFLEMGFSEDDQMDILVPEIITSGGHVKESGNLIFDREIQQLEAFRLQWLEKISLVVLRGFDSQCRDYIKNKRQWRENYEEGYVVSQSLVGALDYLQGKMSIVEESLNVKDFVGVWRSVAAGIDRLLFNNILMSNVKFYDGGVERLCGDLEVIFGVFRTWCLRPEAFFPKSSESSKLLKMGEKQLKDSLGDSDKCIKSNKIRHLRVAEIEKIVKSRAFMS